MIDRPTAFEVAPNPEALKMALKGIEVRSAGDPIEIRIHEIDHHETSFPAARDRPKMTSGRVPRAGVPVLIAAVASSCSAWPRRRPGRPRGRSTRRPAPGAPGQLPNP